MFGREDTCVDGKCDCYCEHDTKDGDCVIQIENIGYKMYVFTGKTSQLDFINITFSVYQVCHNVELKHDCLWNFHIWNHKSNYSFILEIFSKANERYKGSQILPYQHVQLDMDSRKTIPQHIFFCKLQTRIWKLLAWSSQDILKHYERWQQKSIIKISDLYL